MSDTHNDRNAIGPEAGFEYQDEYFLLKLLEMKEGETVSYEKFDDVGVETGKDRTYYQLKHTISTTNNHIAKIAPRDHDLWKTLDMWLGIIMDRHDEVAQRSLDDQIIVIKESSFVFVANKIADYNPFYKNILAYQKATLTIESLKAELKDFLDNTEDKTIKKFIETVHDYDLLGEFLLKVSFVFDTDKSIEEKTMQRLAESHVTGKHASRLMTFLLGAVKKDAQNQFLKNQPIEYTLDSFNQKYERYFHEFKNNLFLCANKYLILPIPQHPWDQTFARQLVDIRRLRKGQDDMLLHDYTQMMLRFANDFHDTCELHGDTLRISIERNAKSKWKNAFDTHTPDEEDSPSEKEIKDAAKLVAGEVLGSEVSVYDGEKLEMDYSNGCYYYFSNGDAPRMGWRMDWKEKYNGTEWITD